MKQTRARFKYAFRQCKRMEAKVKADALAGDMAELDYKKFWKKAGQLNRKSTPVADTINDANGRENIAGMWKDHFQKLYNVVCNDKHKQSVSESLKDTMFNQTDYVSVDEVSKVIKGLKHGKSAGPDGLVAENLIFATPTVVVHLTMCLNAFLSHCYLPDDLIKSVLIPIVKNKCGDLTNADNYRPIALSSVMSKLLEIVLLKRMEDYLTVSDNQFGFRKAHSTDLCVYTLKQLIEFHMKHATPTFICFLDASKAFDRVNHWTLFKKLVDRNVPLYIVRILVYWYSSLEYLVLWNGFLSQSFRVTNGVRQGGVLSPKLYAVFVDDLSHKLNASGIGCSIGGQLLNHFSFADDMALCALTAGGMQRLLRICEEYAVEHDILYNPQKTVCMLVRPKGLSDLRSMDLTVNGRNLRYVAQHKYLGVILSHDRSDVFDIKRQMRSLYMRANMLVRKFNMCSHDVKKHLFQTFCANMYCAQLWSDYTETAMSKLRIAYNNCLRRFLGYWKFCRASGMFVECDIMSFCELVRNYIYSFRSRIVKSSNVLVAAVYDCSVLWRGHLQSEWRRKLYTKR